MTAATVIGLRPLLGAGVITMNASANRASLARWVSIIVVIGVIAVAVLTRGLWWPAIESRVWPERAAAGNDAEDEHAGHDHAGHADGSMIELSPAALKNVGYEPLVVAPQRFVRTINVPGMVVERPGRSQIHITAPLTGVVTRIYPIQGIAIEPNTPMFEIRLTHEELVAAQSDLIRTAESLDVVNREIERLSAVGDGVIAGRRILDQEYEKQKLEASLRADRQALLLHGLSEAHIDAILSERQLFQSMLVSSPPHTDDADACEGEHLFHVQQLSVSPGQQVTAGQPLCILADHCELYIEGRAFEDDAYRLRAAARQGWSLSADMLVGSRVSEELTDLALLYLSDQVDPDTRRFGSTYAFPTASRWIRWIRRAIGFWIGVTSRVND
ncbi:MAG: efflux RND transporter periplasmic adaptor subunit [Pirellulaceae bacterium]